MPMSVMPRRSISGRASASRMRPASSSVTVSAVASGRVCERVAREKSSNRRRSVTVRQTRCAFRRRRASRSTSAIRSASSVSGDRAPSAERPLGAHRATTATDLHPARIAVVREGVEVPSGRAPEDPHQRGLAEPRHLRDGGDRALPELPRGHRPDAPQPLDRQSRAGTRARRRPERRAGRRAWRRRSRPSPGTSFVPRPP